MSNGAGGWAAIGQIGAGLASGLAQGGLSYASAQQQQEAQREAYQHRYQWTVEDLRKAGLNPVLAAQHGAGSVGSMSQMDTSGIASATQAASQIAVQHSQAKLNAATAREAGASAEIAEKTRDAMNAKPSLYETRAKTQAGINASTPVGAVRDLAERGGLMSSAAQGVTEGFLQKRQKPWQTPKNWGPPRKDKYHDGGTITKSPRR